MKMYEVTMGYYKTVVVKAEDEQQAKEFAHQGNWCGEGSLVATDDDIVEELK